MPVLTFLKLIVVTKSKRQRRAYGLAMQKVKDRKAKIEQRKQEKKDELERVQEAEKQKEILLEEELLNQGILKDGDDDDKSHASVDKKSEKEAESNHESIVKEKKYEDKQAEKKWGGRVTVTTSVLSLDDFSDDDDLDTRGKKKAVDHEQRKAGDVQKYLDELKGNMPGKRKQTKRVMTKGKNGAAEMRGMGGSSNLRMAQKVLGKAKAKTGGGGGGKKGKKRRGKR